LYGDGESEKNLGRVLRLLRPNVVVGTKFRLAPSERGRIAAAVKASLEASLGRLRLERVDLLQLHNLIGGDAPPPPPPPPGPDRPRQAPGARRGGPRAPGAPRRGEDPLLRDHRAG